MKLEKLKKHNLYAKSTRYALYCSHLVRIKNRQILFLNSFISENYKIFFFTNRRR